MKHSKLSTDGYKILMSDLTDTELSKIKKELTVIPHAMDMTKEQKDLAQYEVFTSDERYIYVPRYYGTANFGTPTYEKFVPESATIKFNGTLRDYQYPIVSKCIEHMKTKGGGLLSVPCGAGKTTMALKIASELGLKTLVIVHKTFLKDQWHDRAKQFTDAKIGSIRQKVVDVEGKNIVIGLIQSISKRTYEPDLFKQFGLVIYDECHHVASKTFSRALAKTGAKYTLGLSATPYRLDGLIKVMHWYVGEIMFQIKLKTNNQVLAKVFTYKSSAPTFKEYSRFFSGKVRPDHNKMLKSVIELDDRNKVISDIINHLRRDPKRTILVISWRKNHLKILKDKIDEYLNNDYKKGLLEKNECMTCYFTGDSTQEERKHAEQCGDIIFATYDMAAEALDIERLNTIIMATSKKDVNQAVGRILRKVLSNGDTRPLIIDINDDISIFKNQSKKREKYYKDSKYNIERYYIHNSDYVSLDKYDNPSCKDKCEDNLNVILAVPPVMITGIEPELTNQINHDDPNKPDKSNVQEQTKVIKLFAKKVIKPE